MSTTDPYGAAQAKVGAAEREIGDALGTQDLQAEGAKNELKGAARKTSAKVRKAVETATDRISEGAVSAMDHGREAFDRASEGAQQLKNRMDPFVTERPYAALGAGLAIGAVIGLLLAGRRPKVIYVRRDL